MIRAVVLDEGPYLLRGPRSLTDVEELAAGADLDDLAGDLVPEDLHRTANPRRSGPSCWRAVHICGVDLWLAQREKPPVRLGGGAQGTL